MSISFLLLKLIYSNRIKFTIKTTWFKNIFILCISPYTYSATGFISRGGAQVNSFVSTLAERTAISNTLKRIYYVLNTIYMCQYHSGRKVDVNALVHLWLFRNMRICTPWYGV